MAKKNNQSWTCLSGGGAKGFAHIGVLKEIDKAGIQLDYIGGTSMGAILGGLYAAGYSGNSNRRICKKHRFLSIFCEIGCQEVLLLFLKKNTEKTPPFATS